MESDIFHFEIGRLFTALVSRAAVSASIFLASSTVKMPFSMSVSTSGLSDDTSAGGVAGSICARALRLRMTNFLWQLPPFF